jgi:dolichyl-phosphate-mannose-protein mannosyltransferase
LAGNPIIWFSGLAGLILSFVLVAGKIFFNLEIKNKKTFSFILFFLILYFGYMIPVMQVDRVLYLYHYFIPLLFSLFLFILIIYYIFEADLKNNDLIVYSSLIIFTLIVVGVFLYFSPFTYYIPISAKEFLDRTWFDFWGLQNVN